VPVQAGNKALAPAAPASQTRLPWPLLRRGNADVSLQAADLLIGGQHYRDFVTHAVLQDGRLLMQPLQASGPAGVIAARLQLDAGAAPPKLDLWMHPAMLPAPMLMKLLGGPDEVHGTVELVGEVQAAGESQSSLAASATGHVGASMTDGVVATAGLARLIGGSSEIAAVLPRSGETAVRCLALHARLAGGQADIDTLSLRTGRLSVDGHGDAALADGALALHLRPSARIGSVWMSLPVLLGGSLRDPHPTLDRGSSGSRYALTIGGGGAAPADCMGPLQVAREGVAGPAPGAVQTAAVQMGNVQAGNVQAGNVQAGAGGKQKKPKVIDILRGLGILH
jgi:AsmA protein